MRKIYLIRHGKPEFPGGDRYCLGVADFSLDILGRLQACQVAHALKEETITVFTSPLKRAYDTAAFLSPSPLAIADMREMSAGEWDGLSFREIKKKWPDIYEARANNTDLPIPGCEDWSKGQGRFIKAIDEALCRSTGDIAIVAHTTVILSFICHVMGSTDYRSFSFRQDYGGYYIVTLSDNGELRCEFPWKRPVPEMDEELCRKLMAAAEVPEHIIAHCEAVAVKALELCDTIEATGHKLNKNNVCHAALLHDIARLHPDHPKLGAEWLEELGYANIASIIRQHHVLDSTNLDEAALVYIADKLVHETKPVSLKERFEKSMLKCSDAQALEAHRQKMAQAITIAKRINQLCNMEVII